MKKLKIFVSYATMLTLIPFVLSGCGKKSECEIPSRHVHKYTKIINDDITTFKYLDNEYLSTLSGYEWTDEYIEINKKDERFYNLINGMLEGSENWDYMFYKMSSYQDYLEYYYEYDEIETYIEKDENGKEVTKTRTVHHSGWTNNKNYSNNTGRVKLTHYQFYGFRVIEKDGTFILEKSPSVDDVRDIIYDYPYYRDDFSSTVSIEFRVAKSSLSKLNAYDPTYNPFIHPNLSNSSIDLDGNKSLKK